MNRALAVLLPILVAGSTVLQAQALDPAALQSVVNSAAYRANIGRLFAQLPAEVFQRCPALVSKGSTVLVIDPVSFSQTGFPISGVWKQSFPVSGCGNDTTINFFFTAQADQKILSTIAIPGETHAGLTLQRDAFRYVASAVHAKAKDCPSFQVRTTSYDGSDPDWRKKAPQVTRTTGQPWRETWAVSACGQMLSFPVTFIPDATGTTISVEAQKGAP